MNKPDFQTIISFPAMGVTRSSASMMLAAMFCGSIGSEAATVTAKADNTDDLNLGSSWVGGIAPSTADTAVWDATVTSANTTILGADLTLAGIRIEDPADLVTINPGNTLTLGGPETAIDLSAATQDLTLDCDLSLGAANVWDVVAPRTLTLGGAVSGSSAITKLGAGDLLFNGSVANGFTGGLNIGGGTVTLDFANLATPTDLINPANALTLGNGGTLRITGQDSATDTFQTLASTTLAGGGANTISLTKGATATSATLNLGQLTIQEGSVTRINGITENWGTAFTPVNEQFFITAGGSVPALPTAGNRAYVNAGLVAEIFPGDVAGSARWVSVDSNGQLGGQIAATVTLANGLTGQTVVAQDNASGAAAANLGSSADIYGLLANNNTANANITRLLNNNVNLTVNGITQFRDKSYTIARAASSNGNVIIGSERNLVINMDNTGALVINAPIVDNTAGASAVTFTSTIQPGTPGSVTLGGTNTYTGATYVTGGATLVMNNANRIANSSKISIAGGSKIDYNIAGNSSFTLADGQDVEGTGVGSASVNTGSEAFNNLRTTGNTTFSHTGTGTLAFQRLDIAGTGNAMTGGNIQSGLFDARRGLNVGANAAGEFTISGGTFTSNGGTATQFDSIGINTGGSGTFNINGGHYVNAGMLSFGQGPSNHLGGTLNVNSGSATIGTLRYNTDTTSGQGIVNLSGGMLTLGAIQSLNGATREFNLDGGQFVASDNLEFENTLTLNVKDGGANIDTGANTVTVSGDLVNFGGTSTGGLTKIGSGTLTLAGANSYTGATVISAGTLALGAGNVIPDGSSVELGSATLSAATFTDEAGTLDLTGAATINLGAGAALAFLDSSAIDWSGGTLQVTGTFVSGSSLRFGDDADGLLPAQLAQISISGFTGIGIDSSGFITATSTGGYSVWAAVNAPTGTSEDDFDEDGVTNGVEFVLGGDKDTNDLDKLPKLSASGGDMLFTFERDQDSIGAGTTVTIEVSTDLADWTTGSSPYAVPDSETGPVNPGVAVEEDTPVIGVDTVILTLPRSPDDRKFARLKVTIIP